MTSLRRPTTFAVGLLLAVVLAACGSSSSGGSTVTPSGGATSNSASGPTVTIQNFKFQPASLTVKAGTKVTFIQEDSVAHNATASGPNAFHTPTLSKGQKYTVTFTKPGTYPYICTIHPFMHGTIVVS